MANEENEFTFTPIDNSVDQKTQNKYVQAIIRFLLDPGSTYWRDRVQTSAEEYAQSARVPQNQMMARHVDFMADLKGNDKSAKKVLLAWAALKDATQTDKNLTELFNQAIEKYNIKFEVPQFTS